MRSLACEPLTPEAFAPFGRVVSGGLPDRAELTANQGTARRFPAQAELVNLRAASARLDVSVYRCRPREAWPFEVALLERHAFTTQLLVPMTATRWVVLVSLGGGAPELATARAFLAEGHQGIAYAPAIWHHPLLALDRETDFTSLVWADGSDGDCEVSQLSQSERFALTLPP